MLELDGSFGEGGGQILRTSLCWRLLPAGLFACGIRAGRARPGLHAQHLACVNAAVAISGARAVGGMLGSMELTFEPGQVVPGKYKFTIGTAGATGLVLQTVVLPLVLRAKAPSDITIEGGTHVLASPCFHFLDVTWRRYLELAGLKMGLLQKRAGFYPRGGGVVDAQLLPCPQLNGLFLMEPNRVTSATGFSAVAGLPAHIARRQLEHASRRLTAAGLSIDLREETWAGGPGSVLAIVLGTKPVPTLFFGLGARGKPAEQVAEEAVEQTLSYLRVIPAVVDAHSADQLVLPLALASGPSSFRVAEMTEHLLTNIAVIKQFLDRNIYTEGDLTGPGVVHIA